MTALRLTAHIVGAALALFLLLTASTGFVTADPWIGLFMLILGAMCLYRAFLLRKVLDACNSRIEHLEMAARAESRHDSITSGRILAPEGVGPLGPRGVSVGAILTTFLAPAGMTETRPQRFRYAHQRAVGCLDRVHSGPLITMRDGNSPDLMVITSATAGLYAHMYSSHGANPPSTRHGRSQILQKGGHMAGELCWFAELNSTNQCAAGLSCTIVAQRAEPVMRTSGHRASNMALR